VLRHVLWADHTHNALLQVEDDPMQWKGDQDKFETRMLYVVCYEEFLSMLSFPMVSVILPRPLVSLSSQLSSSWKGAWGTTC
jgi:hypothetical protein